MPKRTITEVDELQVFLERVISRAEARDLDVNRVILVLSGAVIWAKNGLIRVADREGNLGNHLWFRVQGQTYCLKYSHKVKVIEVRLGSRDGPVLHEFTNSSTAAEIFEVFSDLKFGERPGLGYPPT